jgi:hypothetical protein
MISTEVRALARWLSSYLYVHEAIGEWEAYVDEAERILDIISQAKSGATRVEETSMGTLYAMPDGELILIGHDGVKIE